MDCLKKGAPPVDTVQEHLRSPLSSFWDVSAEAATRDAACEPQHGDGEAPCRQAPGWPCLLISCSLHSTVPSINLRGVGICNLLCSKDSPRWPDAADLSRQLTTMQFDFFLRQTTHTDTLKNCRLSLQASQEAELLLCIVCTSTAKASLVAYLSRPA